MEITSALPDLHLDEAQPPDSPFTPEKENQSDGSTEGPPAMSSPVQFIGINYFPPSPIDVQTTSQQPPDPTPWESGAVSPLSEDYVVVGLPTFPPKPCVLFSRCLSSTLAPPPPSFPDSLIHIPILCSVLFNSLTLEHSTGKTRRGNVPISSYRFGPPGRDSVFYTPPMGRIGVHHPREIVRVERDYTGGEIVQFASVYPMELEGRVSFTFSCKFTRHAPLLIYLYIFMQITPRQFMESINAINEILISANSLWHSVFDNVIEIFSLQLSRLVISTHYERVCFFASGRVNRG
jgi:hypothetical protein